MGDDFNLASLRDDERSCWLTDKCRWLEGFIKGVSLLLAHRRGAFRDVYPTPSHTHTQTSSLVAFEHVSLYTIQKGKTPKKRKIRKNEKNYNFLKIVSIVEDFCSQIVKFDLGLRNNFLEFVPVIDKSLDLEKKLLIFFSLELPGETIYGFTW